MKNLIRKTAANILIIASGMALLQCASASDFGLESISASDLRGSEFNAAPAPLPQARMTDSDDFIDMDMAIKIPFKVIKRAVVMVAATEKRLAIIDPSAPVVSKAGEFMKISNISFDANGIVINPTLTLKPYLEGRDLMAVRIQRIQLHASVSADKSASNEQPVVNQEEIMAQVMGVITDSITGAINESLIAKQSPLRASDIVVFKYDKSAWTLHVAVSAASLKLYLLGNLVGDIHLTGFAFDDKAISIKMGTTGGDNQ